MKNFFRLFKRKKFYAQLIGKNQLCFDIGANNGEKSKLFLSLGAAVTAFEPQSSCFEKLNLLKKKHSNFSFYPFAVGAKNEELQLRLANHSEVATLSDAFVDYFTCDEIFWDKKENVTVKSLDYLIEKFGLPTFCKIDVEGYEYEILSNLNHKIPIIEFEFTGGFITDTLKIITLMDNENTSFNYILNENLKFMLNDWITAQQMKKIIASLPINKLHGNIFVKYNGISN